MLERKKARQLGPVSMLSTSFSRSSKQTSLYVLENQLYLVFSASLALLVNMSTLFAKPYRCKTNVSFPCLRSFQTPITSFTLQWQAFPSYLAFQISWNHMEYANIYYKRRRALIFLSLILPRGRNRETTLRRKKENWWRRLFLALQLHWVFSLLFWDTAAL